MTIQISRNKIVTALVQVYSEFVKEEMKVEIMDTDIYVFGSELACLRLFYYTHKHKNQKKHIVEYSPNLNSWFIKIENGFFEISKLTARQ